MNGIGKKMIMGGLTAALLFSPLTNNETTAVKEVVKVTQNSTQKNELTKIQAVELATSFSTAASYVQRGGDYKQGEYKTFNYQGKTYRYLASTIDTKKEFIAYLGKTLTQSAAEKWLKSTGIIEYKGKLAQVEADGGSLLQWNRATAEYIKTDKNTVVYRLAVPIGDTKDKEYYLVNYQFVQKLGWRISAEPTMDDSVLTAEKSIQLATNYAKAATYVQAGGSYREGEYKTFTYKGKTYRYLSSQIDTKKELLAYLKESLTHSTAEKFIQAKGIIEYNGKMAQLEADGGSLLQWHKASAELLKEEKNSKTYLFTIPVGETKEKQQYVIDFQYVEKIGWRISKEPYWNLDVPGNVNPAFQFFNHILVQTTATENLFLNPSSFKVEDFKKGIQKLEYQDMKEINRTSSSVDYLVRFKAELNSSYKGDLIQGENYMYFSIQPVGYMDFKIVKIGVVKIY
jgi:iseA protein